MGGVGESNLMLKDRKHCGGGQAREKLKKYVQSE